MSYEDIQPLKIVYTNELAQDVIATVSYKNHHYNTIENPLEYNLRVKNAVTDLGNMMLDNMPKYQICLFVNDKSLATGNLKYGPNYFNIQGTEYSPIYEVTDLLDWLFYVFSKQTPTPIISFDLDTSTELFSYTMTNDQYNTYFTLNGKDQKLQIYFNEYFKPIFKEFMNYKLPITLPNSGENWYTFSTSIAPESSTTVTQKLTTVQRMVNARVIEFQTDLQVKPYLVQDFLTGEIVPRNIIATTIINRETFNVLSKTDNIYIPQTVHDVTFNGNNPINNFSVTAYIVYSDDTRVALTLPSYGFFSLEVVFVKIKKIND